MTANKENYIAIAKALGIILMVMGHSGCPTIINNFLYLFHMPLFFFFSGYFFKKTNNKSSYINFCTKKIKGLYIPYLKWSIGFLILHNLFYQINIYSYITNSYKYELNDFIEQTIKTIAMTDYELLIRPFWFIKELLYTTISVATIDYLSNHFIPKLHRFFILLVALISAFITNNLPPIPLIGNISLLLLSITFYYSGILYKKYEYYLNPSFKLLTICFIITFIRSYYLPSPIDMRFLTKMNTIPYYIFSLIGILMIICISTKLNNCIIKNHLYYIGNHTMPILALNLLALKAGNLIKILLYNMPMEYLSSHTIIEEHNKFFWIFYSIIGVFLPLSICYIYNKYILNNRFFYYF